MAKVNQIVTFSRKPAPRSNLRFGGGTVTGMVRFMQLRTNAQVEAERQADRDGARASGSPYGWTLDDAGEPRLYSNEQHVPASFPPATKLRVLQTSNVSCHYNWGKTKPVLLVDDETGIRYLASRQCLVPVA